MKRTFVVLLVILNVLLLCGVALAQEPVENIDTRLHPHLAQAQRLVMQANREVAEAQKLNNYDMKGHAEKARDLLVQVNQELKAAAEAANAANAAKAAAGKKKR